MGLKRILAVDDMPSVLNTIRYMLNQDYQVFPFVSGQDAMEFLEKGVAAIDLVLLDVDMPGFSGLELLKTLKSHPTLKEIPVIMLTGNSERATVQQAAMAGVADYIVKPFTKGVLKHKLRVALSGAGEDFL